MSVTLYPLFISLFFDIVVEVFPNGIPLHFKCGSITFPDLLQILIIHSGHFGNVVRNTIFYSNQKSKLNFSIYNHMKKGNSLIILTHHLLLPRSHHKYHHLGEVGTSLHLDQGGKSSVNFVIWSCNSHSKFDHRSAIFNCRKYPSFIFTI